MRKFRIWSRIRYAGFGENSEVVTFEDFDGDTPEGQVEREVMDCLADHVAQYIESGYEEIVDDAGDGAEGIYGRP